jgi:hypothetical protein
MITSVCDERRQEDWGADCAETVDLRGFFVIFIPRQSVFSALSAPHSSNLRSLKYDF